MARACGRFPGLRSAAAAVVLLAGASLAAAQDAPLTIAGAKTVDSKGVIDLISATAGIAVIDNRTKADFDSGHIEGAVNIPDTDMAEPVLAGAVKAKATPVLFYCNGVKCGRAAKATAKAVGRASPIAAFAERQRRKVLAFHSGKMPDE